MEIKIGYALAKPVETQAQCDAYTAMVEAVNAHNAACAVGDTLWSIADKPGCYEVTDGGVKPDPADQPEPEPALNEKLEALQEDNKMLKQCLMEMSEMHYDNGLLTEDDIAEVEQLAQAYYDALDAEDKADQELKENVKIGA